jgi:hypothetical protein
MLTLVVLTAAELGTQIVCESISRYRDSGESQVHPDTEYFYGPEPESEFYENEGGVMRKLAI